uniref:2-(3-amino-3-carboxypropyl)histidine synthase n=1 Tax=Timema cristinae TaxID=61476 RepID=A0A7R9D7T1_TIMCR|nr:unnamed protein product [Timema cristinae]
MNLKVFELIVILALGTVRRVQGHPLAIKYIVNMFGFSSNETVSITKKVEIKDTLTLTPIESIAQVYELDRCTSWIQDICVNKVCLQFPDALLGDSVEVALSLGKRIGRQVYILGDTSYGRQVDR